VLVELGVEQRYEEVKEVLDGEDSVSMKGMSLKDPAQPDRLKVEVASSDAT
jgi:hypothetical protein